MNAEAPSISPEPVRLRIKRYLKFLLIAIAIFLIGTGIYYYYRYFIEMRMSQNLIERANAAMAQGITVMDDQNDEVSMGAKEPSSKEKPNNPETYKEPYLDIQSLSVGIDDEYFYYKITYYGTIPDLSPHIGNNDAIYANTSKLNIVNDEGEDQVIMYIEYSYLPMLRLPSINTYYSTDPTGIEWPENARFATENRDSKISGGHGTDYVMGAIPLENLHIKKGDTINFVLGNESASKKYDHASMDALGGTWKEGDTIVWKTDTDQYTVKGTTNDGGVEEKD